MIYTKTKLLNLINENLEKDEFYYDSRYKKVFKDKYLIKNFDDMYRDRYNLLKKEFIDTENYIVCVFNNHDPQWDLIIFEDLEEIEEFIKDKITNFFINNVIVIKNDRRLKFKVKDINMNIKSVEDYMCLINNKHYIIEWI